MARPTKQKKGVSVRHSAEIAALYQKAGVSRKSLCSIFKQYSPATIYRHAIKPIGQKHPLMLDEIIEDVLKLSPCKTAVQP